MAQAVPKKVKIAAGLVAAFLVLGILAVFISQRGSQANPVVVPWKKGMPHVGKPHTGPLAAAIRRDKATGKLVLVEVTPGGAAANAGLKKGDLLLKIDNVVVDEFLTAATTLGRYKPGDKITVRIKRGGVEKDVPVVLGEATP